jgi:hypothetical protein
MRGKARAAPPPLCGDRVRSSSQIFSRLGHDGILAKSEAWKANKANLFLDSKSEKIYDKFISCKEFWFGTKTSRRALGAYGLMRLFY